jgi:hypoxanthine phosphoribosyltransferase
MKPGDFQSYGDLAQDISEILYTTETIQQRVFELGASISADYQDKNPLLVGVLKGVVFFMADLLRAINIPVEVDFIAVSSYSPESREQGLVRMVKDLEIPISGRHVIFVEDVIDTGLTLNYILRNLRTREPASLQVCTLFDKPDHRLIDLPVKYKGFDLPGYFVVGYGLDFREKYRNLPFVGVLKAEVFKPGAKQTKHR